MKANNPGAIADGRCYQPHRALAADRRANGDIKREAPSISDSVLAKPLHRRARPFRVKCNGLLARHGRPAGQTEQVVDPARPDERIIGKVAFPAARMLEPETADFGGFDDVGYDRAQHMAELELLGLLEQRPGVIERERIDRPMMHQSPRPNRCSASVK